MYTNVITIMGILGLAQAHMHLHYPPTLLGDNNPFTPQGKADPRLNYPYGCCGQTVTALCKGHLDLLDQPEGQPVVTWAPGQKANFSVSGHRIDSPQENPVGGTHAGGSSQIGISLDQGKTFKVIKTWQGNFPDHNMAKSLDPADHTYDFTVPADLPSGKAVFAWTWVNREKEFNMNCASVMISGNGQNPPPAPQPTQPKQPQKPEPTQEPQQPEPTQEPQQPEPTQQPQQPEQPEQPNNPPISQFTLQGCTCACPAQTWSKACECYSCSNPATSRRDVQRRALALHRRNLERSAALNVPHRRAEAVAFSARPEMALNIDLPNSNCKSPGNPAELRFPNPGPDVVEKQGNDGYELVEPTC